MDPIKRYELIRPIITGEKTVSEVEQESGLSSRTIYRYLLRFREGNENLESLRNKSHAIHSHPKWLTDDDKALVISYQLSNPSKSTRQIADDLKAEGILDISYRTVANILKEGHLQKPFFSTPDPREPQAQAQRVEHLISLYLSGQSVQRICNEHNVAPSTFYYWYARYKTEQTYENLSSAPHSPRQKVTDEVKAAVIKKQQENPKLGCWRLSLFEYENQTLSAATIWRILNENKRPKTPPDPLYHFSHPHQMWFIDHMHLKTLKDQTKVYRLIIIDGFSRVLLSDETVLSKGAIDAISVLLNAFARFGLPEMILSDNAKAFSSFVYRLLLGVLRVGVRYTEPGHPWENPYAESLIGTLRAYFYPYIQRQKSVASIAWVYASKARYYNHRVHWKFHHDEIKTPITKLADERGRPLPPKLELSYLATAKRKNRRVDGQGRISWNRYQLYVRIELAKGWVEIREYVDSLVVTYQSGTVVSYHCLRERNQITEVENAPVFHDHSGIEHSPQLELFDLSEYELRYVSKRPRAKRKRCKVDATQWLIWGIFPPKRKR